MKKLLSLVVAGGLLVGSAAVASATDIKVKGTFDFGFGLYDGTNFSKHDGEESFDAVQRFRTQIDFIASESLKGVAAFEIGNTSWGNGGGATWGGGVGAGRGTGGAMGADGVSVEAKNLYIDWLVPNTDLQVRMGIQPFALPMAVWRGDYEGAGFILDDDLAGILLSYNFNENVGVNLGWFRPWDPYINGDDNDANPQFSNHDEIDVFALTIPIELKDTFSFTPYGMFANVGEVNDGEWDAAGTFTSAETIGLWLSANDTLGHDGKAWWAGFAFDLSYFDPFVAAVDFAYGKYTADDVAGVSPDRDGWIVQAKFGYKLDYFTPILFGWYGSGSDMDDGDLAREGWLPSLSPDWGMTSFGWSNAHFAGREYLVGDSPAGTWAIGVGLDDIKFIDNLTSYFRVAYFRGTNDVEDYNLAVKNGLIVGQTDAFREFGLLDTSDWGLEINLDNVINIYENLDMYVELAYVHVSLDHDSDDFEDNAWKGYVGFTYSF